MKMTTEYNTPKELAIALLNDSEPDMLFLSETMEWVDHLGFNPEFTVRALDYFIGRVLEAPSIKVAGYDEDALQSLLDNIVRLSAKARQERTQTEEKTNV